MKPRRNKLCVYVHFVWATRDRLPLIQAEIERDLYRCIVTICQDNKCVVLAVGGMEDHIHLLVALPSTLSLAECMRHVKGGSSRFVTEMLKPGSWFAWQENYGAFSVSAHHKDKVIAYILDQKRHHAEATLWNMAEETDEEAQPP